MFDPTAFDNLKTVLEGMIYDDDLHGEVRVTNREDLLNLAKMNRLFRISFHLPERKNVNASIILEMTTEQIYQELIEKIDIPRCRYNIQFLVLSSHLFHVQTHYELLKNVWDAPVSVNVSYNPMEKERTYEILYEVKAHQDVTEEDLEILENDYLKAKSLMVKVDQ